MARKYTVKVRLMDVNRNELQQVDVVMFSNSNLSNINDIFEDFTDKLDLYPKKYGLDQYHYNWFNVVSLTNNKKETSVFN